MKNIIAAKTNCYKGFSKEETFEGLKKAGFKYIEISATPGSNTGLDRFKSFSEICAIKEEIENLGLIPIAMGGHTNIMDENLINDFINNIKLAHFFNCKYIVTSVGDAHKLESEVADNKTIAEHIKRFVPFLEEYDMYLVIESHGHHALGSILKEICELSESKRVMINYDTGNVIYFAGLSNEELLKDIEGCIDRIGYMHLKDKLGEKDEWNFPALGQGYVPIKEIMDILEKHQNACPLTVEIEFTKEGVKDVSEVDQALDISNKYLNQFKK